MPRAGRSIRSACTGTFRRIKWIVLFVTLGIYYLLPFLRWDRGPERAGPGGAGRSAEPALLFLLHRDLAAGGLLPHRPADPRGDGAVPDERGRRPRLVRLSLPADGVDRPVPDHRALDRGRPPRAHAARRGSRGRSSASRAQGAQAFPLADGRVVDRRRLGALFRRRADAGEGPRDRSRRRSSPMSGSASSPSRPTRSPATCASRSASICARGRASRRR